MYFEDIIGQQEAKKQLITEANTAKVPHARMISGSQGTGKLPLAIAYARYLLCENPKHDDACGRCPSCIMINSLAHPDMHFVFPVVKKKGKDTTSDDYLPQWRELLKETPYFDLNTWLDTMGAENQQAQIYVKESDYIVRKLSLKPSRGGYKVMIIWLPEKMNTECSNKLLKLLEEPPAQTLFMLVTEAPAMMLETIVSRTRRMELKPIGQEHIASALCTRYGIQPADAEAIAHRCEGSFLKAMEAIHLNQENAAHLESFIALMRLAYQRKVREMKQWSENMAAMGRERQKHFLQYALRMIRENFVYNFHEASINHFTPEELNFATRFAPFVNERNVMGIMNELQEAERHIAQNVNPKMVFFDFALKMIVLLVQK